MKRIKIVAMVMRWCCKLANKQLLGQCQIECSTETDCKNLLIAAVFVTIKTSKLSLCFSMLLSDIS